MNSSRRLAPVFALVFAFAVLPLAACSFDNQRVSSHVHQNVAMPKAGSLHVSEPAGTIRVEAWDKPFVSVDATKHASDEGALGNTRIDVKPAGGGVDISATRAGSNLFGRSGDVEFVIRAPANADLDLSSGAGVIEVRGSRASVKARTSAGQIAVRMALVGGAQQIALHATTGQITLRIPRSSSATVDASAMLGSTRNDFHASTIGSGAATVSLHVITGEVVLSPTN